MSTRMVCYAAAANFPSIKATDFSSALTRRERANEIQMTRTIVQAVSPGQGTNRAGSWWAVLSHLISITLRRAVFLFSFCVCVSVLTAQLWPTVCDPMDYSPPGSSVLGDSLGRNTGVGCHSLLQEIFPTKGSNLGLSHGRQILYCLCYEGSPCFILQMRKLRPRAVRKLVQSHTASSRPRIRAPGPDNQLSAFITTLHSLSLPFIHLANVYWCF